ncbi:threonine synthase [bacterium]|nr:threonine synthase [bacterium]
MKIEDFDQELQKVLLPHHKPEMIYECIGCGNSYPLDRFLYTCPSCRSLLRLKDLAFDLLKDCPGVRWREIFDKRRLLNIDPLKGIFLFHELVLPVVPLEDIVYLGEGHTPIVNVNKGLAELVGMDFSIKYDGLNPSASFKDRGMATAVSFINHFAKSKGREQILGICASTGDTSAAAALYLAYLDHEKVKSVVLLPQGKVTPQQLSQPLGSGATVIEIPGVFDDCMKIVEELAETYDVVLLNSKNPVRIAGQKSYSYEIAQQLDYQTDDLVVIVPIGNAGNITAVMEGFLDLYNLGIIAGLPYVIGVQSFHADPVYRWHRDGVYKPVKVSPSVAQAAMIGDPVSFPKVNKLVTEHFRDKFSVVHVTEQDIIEWMLKTNRHGHVVCTQGGETVAGLKEAVRSGIVGKHDRVVVDSTSHQLKFAGFQQKYFDNSFPDEYEIKPDRSMSNAPVQLPASAGQIAKHLGLKERKHP